MNYQLISIVLYRYCGERILEEKVDLLLVHLYPTFLSLCWQLIYLVYCFDAEITHSDFKWV